MQYLEDIVIPNSVTYIGTYTFIYCGGRIDIPDSVTYLDDLALYGTYATYVKLPNTLTTLYGGSSIGFLTNAIYLEEVVLPNNLVEIGAYAFKNCAQLKTINIPDSVTTIGTCAFMDCASLTSLTLPNNITSVPASLILNCNSIHTVTLGTNVTDVAGNALDGCTGIKNIVLNTSTPPTVPGDYLYLDVSLSSVTLTVPQGALTAYQEATAWKYFNIVEAE